MFLFRFMLRVAFGNNELYNDLYSREEAPIRVA